MSIAQPNNGLRMPLKALAVLLHYPDGSIQDHADELADALAMYPEFTPEDRSAAERFVQELTHGDLLELQADYVETFDRSKKVSLYLFEHVHGESRDRGPAMVELRMAYRERGLDLDCTELPDYLPMFLEFCTQIEEHEAQAWLDDVAHILQRIHVRLADRGSRYALPFRLLLRIAHAEPAPPDLVAELTGEERDDTREALDSVWQEAPVTFEAGSALGACSGGAGRGGTSPQQP